MAPLHVSHPHVILFLLLIGYIYISMYLLRAKESVIVALLITYFDYVSVAVSAYNLSKIYWLWRCTRLGNWPEHIYRISRISRKYTPLHSHLVVNWVNDFLGRRKPYLSSMRRAMRLMVRVWMMLGAVVAPIVLTTVPIIFELSLGLMALEPVVSHLYWFSLFWDDCIVCKSNISWVVSLDGRSWLRPDHFDEGLLKTYDLFRCEE